MPENHRAVVRLKERFGDSVLECRLFRGELTVTVQKEQILKVLETLKEDLGYDFLTDVTAVDFLTREPRFLVVYHLFSTRSKERVRIKSPVRADEPSIASSTCLWSTANWLEREVYDLMGITFQGHPDLRRILMTEDWVGHPLRKDYPLQGPGREPYQGRVT